MRTSTHARDYMEQALALADWSIRAGERIRAAISVATAWPYVHGRAATRGELTAIGSRQHHMAGGPRRWGRPTGRQPSCVCCNARTRWTEEILRRRICFCKAHEGVDERAPHLAGSGRDAGHHRDLVMGLWSMVYNDGDNSPFDEEHWMIYRVILQALAALVATSSWAGP